MGEISDLLLTSNELDLLLQQTVTKVNANKSLNAIFFFSISKTIQDLIAASYMVKNILKGQSALPYFWQFTITRVERGRAGFGNFDAACQARCTLAIRLDTLRKDRVVCYKGVPELSEGDE